jgi:hypothetical protein
MSISDRARRHPFLAAVLCVTVPAAIGFAVAQRIGDSELRKLLLAGSVTLIFGGFFGGLLKILFDDFTLSRHKREEHGAFVTNVLGDLKSVYDRVGRVRILIPAHRSAKTYGDEMRALIEARVTLKNVLRALDRRAEGLNEKARPAVIKNVGSMEKYLERLTDEFRKRYKAISNCQRVYESNIEAALKAAGPEATADMFQETVWLELQRLEQLQGLIDDGLDAPYRLEFEGPLDNASRLLRDELRRILAGEPPTEPLAASSVR